MNGFTLMELLSVVAIVAVAVAVVAAVGHDANSPTVTLKVSEWRCTQERTEIVLVPMLVGKIIVQQPQTQTVCSRWERMQ